MTVTDVNQLVARFEQAAKMMKTVAKGGMPQMPGMGPIPGAHGGKKANAKKKGKGGSRSGNPAKRAAENAALAQGVKPGGGATGGGSGFGLGGGGSTQQGPSEEELAALQKLLGRR